MLFEKFSKKELVIGFIVAEVVTVGLGALAVRGAYIKGAKDLSVELVRNIPDALSTLDKELEERRQVRRHKYDIYDKY